MESPKILIVACDPYLAGIYGRKFELDNWEVEIAEDLADGEKMASKSRPNIILLDKDCSVNIVEEIGRFKALPTLMHTKIVILANESDKKEIDASLFAGASDYLLLGHFVPQEAVSKLRKML